MGITEDSLVHDADALARQVRSVHEAYGEPALVDEFLPGREFTVGLLGNGPPRVLPVTEINFAAVPPGYPRIYTYRFKKAWDEARFYRCPAPLDSELSGRISDTARRAFTALGCLDVARIDLRLDRGGTPRCIDVNPLPGMAPGFSDLPRQADAAGLADAAKAAAGLADAAKADAARAAAGLADPQADTARADTARADAPSRFHSATGPRSKGSSHS